MLNYSLETKIYTQSDFIASGCFDLEKAICICEAGLRDFNDGKVKYMEKISMVLREESQERINCLVSSLASDNVNGLKWISVFPNNPVLYNIPNVSAVIILSDMNSGYPIAIMDGALCSSLRTASVSAVAAKYLSRNTAESIGIIGAGEQARMHFLAMKEVRPNICKCKIASRTESREIEFIEEMKRFCTDVDFEACKCDYKKAALDADVIVTAISGQEMILQSEWIKEGCFYCHVAGLEDSYSVAQRADKIVCDSWETVKHREQTISQMYKKGLLGDEDIYADLYEIVCGHKAGRSSEDEFIYFNAVGLPFLDVKLANWMRNTADGCRKGHFVNLRRESMFQEESNRRMQEDEQQFCG